MSKFRSAEEALAAVQAARQAGARVEVLLEPRVFRKYAKREPLLAALLEYFGGENWGREKLNWDRARGDVLALGLHCEHLAALLQRIEGQSGKGESLGVGTPSSETWCRPLGLGVSQGTRTAGVTLEDGYIWTHTEGSHTSKKHEESIGGTRSESQSTGGCPACQSRILAELSRIQPPFAARVGAPTGRSVGVSIGDNDSSMSVHGKDWDEVLAKIEELRQEAVKGKERETGEGDVWNE